MAEGDGSSGSTAHFNTAAVHIVFQTRPGTVANRRITTAGDATLTLHSGAVSQVQPVEGIYHFDMPVGETAILELFGTQYNVIRVNGTDPDPTGERTIVVWDGALRPIESLDGKLQRLQILGYYYEALDTVMSQAAETAILEFQADNDLIIDGVAGPRTQTKLQEIISRFGNAPGSRQPLNRRYLVFFERAAFGITRRNEPQIDFRGGGPGKFGIPLTMINPTITPGVVAAPVPEFYRIGCFPRNLDETSLPWHLAFQSNNGTVQLRSSILSSFSDRVEIIPTAVGEDVLLIRQGTANGPIVATLEVQVMQMMEVKLWGHLLTVEATGTGARLADPPNWTRAEAQSLIDIINNIWNPMGISFVYQNFEEHVLQEAEAGWIIDDYVHNRQRSNPIARRFNRTGAINVYFTQHVKQIFRDADGNIEDSEPIAFAGNRWDYIPSFVFTGRLLGLSELARALAHEFGHMLRLTPAAEAHTDDRGVPTPWRHDLWSRMRLMAKYLHYSNSDPDRTWQSTTYGDSADLMNAGDLISIKNFARDDSDGEMAIARSSARNPGAPNGIAMGS